MSDRTIANMAGVGWRIVLKIRKEAIALPPRDNANATTKPIKPGRVAKDGRRYPASRAKLAARWPRNDSETAAGEFAINRNLPIICPRRGVSPAA